MNGTQLSTALAERHGLSHATARAILQTMLDEIASAVMCGEDVALPSFGRFTVRERPGRVGRKPATGATVVIPASRYLAFKASPKALEPRIA
jgi:DNA-binding protein HU-beta